MNGITKEDVIIISRDVAEKVMAGGTNLTTESWALLVTLAGIFVTVLISFYVSLDNRMSKQWTMFSDTIEKQNLILDKMNQSLISLNTTLEVTTYRTKKLEDDYLKMASNVAVITERLTKVENHNLTTFSTVKNYIDKKIKDTT